MMPLPEVIPKLNTIVATIVAMASMDPEPLGPPIPEAIYTNAAAAKAALQAHARVNG
jgi:hypothetical protein